MKLLMRQKVFSWTDRFLVWDELGRERYTVEGELFSWGKRLHVCDPAGRETLYLEEKLFSFLNRFRLYAGDGQIAEVVREFTLFRPRYTVAGPDWEVRGDFWAHEYEAVDRTGRTVLTVGKEWFTWGDCYELDFSSPEDELLALGTVLAIDIAVARSTT